MNKDVTIDQWLDALRSGKYEQCGGQLYAGDKQDGTKQMCCLGVLADVMGVEWRPMSRRHEGFGFDGEVVDDAWEDQFRIASLRAIDSPAWLQSPRLRGILMNANDNSYGRQGERDYSSVIRIIEELAEAEAKRRRARVAA